MKNCQYHPALQDWPTKNLKNHLCPVCGEKATFNEAMAKRIIESRNANPKNK